MKKVIVVGGGASGMMAAIKAAQDGNEVLLIEKNEKLGKKLFITGKGRCNVTTNKDVQDIIENIPENADFMYSSLYTFTNQDLMKMIEDKGIKLKIERGDRVFPQSDKSSDIIKCFERYLSENKVKIMLGSSVEDILINDSMIIGVKLNNKEIIKCNSVILATGGMSYPLTGSTGDGYEMCKKLGHTVTPLKPSLVPLETKEAWIKDLMGLSLKNVEVTIKNDKKILYKDFGEMLFTHFGVSGPIILSASSVIGDYLPGNLDLFIDLKPAIEDKELDKRLLRDFEKNINKQFKNALNELLPQKLIPVFIDLTKIDPEKQVNSITKEERHKIIETLKSFKITVTKTRPIDEAIITRGGINVKEINPSTMESKLVKGLFITGELLDVDALTGGFNLQIAFSTGYCAGANC